VSEDRSIICYDPMGLNLEQEPSWWRRFNADVAKWLSMPDVKAITIHRETGDFRYEWAPEMVHEEFTVDRPGYKYPWICVVQTDEERGGFAWGVYSQGKRNEPYATGHHEDRAMAKLDAACAAEDLNPRPERTP
jgi:hypothetical protein